MGQFRRYDEDQVGLYGTLSPLAQEGQEFIRMIAKLIVLLSQSSASSSSTGSFGEIACCDRPSGPVWSLPGTCNNLNWKSLIPTIHLLTAAPG